MSAASSPASSPAPDGGTAPWIYLAPEHKAATNDPAKIEWIKFLTGDGSYGYVQMDKGQPLPEGAPYPGTPNPHTFGGFQRWSTKGVSAWNAMLGDQLVEIAGSMPELQSDGRYVVTCMALEYELTSAPTVWLQYTVKDGWVAKPCTG